MALNGHSFNKHGARRIRKRIILVISVMLISLFLIKLPGGVPSAHAIPSLLREVYEVTTRGDFDTFGNLREGVSADAYRIEVGGGLLSGGGIPSLDDLYLTGCPGQVAVVVHGFLNAEEDAWEKFDRARLSLAANNFPGPIIGYSWDSDAGPLGLFVDQWYIDNSVAVLNNLKFDHFLTDFKTHCPTTELRIVAHSLGAKLVVEAIKKLPENSNWTSHGFKIKSVSLLGAAIPSDMISTSSPFGLAIESSVDRFYNYYSGGDDILGSFFVAAQDAIGQHDRALGKYGFESPPSNGPPSSPSNYLETSVENELPGLCDADGDGSCDPTGFTVPCDDGGHCPQTGENHFGYWGFRDSNHRNQLRTYQDGSPVDGAINIVVRDWDREVLPTITISSQTPITVEATSKSGATVTYGITVSDNIDGPDTAVCDPASGTVLPFGSTTIHCTAIEDYVSITVQSYGGGCSRINLPTESCSAGAACGIISNKLVCGISPPPNALDVIDVSCTISFTGTTTDAQGNEIDIYRSSCSGQAHVCDPACDATKIAFEVIVRDTTPPIVTVPSDITKEATGPTGAVVTFPDATATDLVDGLLPAVCSSSTTPNLMSGMTFPLGTTTFTCTAQDAHGNTGSASFRVTVRDTTPPDTKIVLATDPTGAILPPGSFTLFQPATFTFSGTDIVGVAGFECSIDSKPFISCTNPSSFTGLSDASHTLMVRAYDTSGNRDPTPDSFAWTIITPGQAANILADDVGGMPASQATKSSLLGILSHAQQVLNDNDPSNDLSACVHLDTFIKQVNLYLSQGKLTAAEASELLLLANSIKLAIGCK